MSNVTATDRLQWRDLRTGILFVVGIALVGSLALLIGRNSGLFTKIERANLFVEDIQGLTEGNLVSISGKKVGTVDKMDFIRRNDTSGVLLVLSIRAEYFELITRDSKVRIKSLGILGDKYVDISLGNSSTRLASGDELAVVIDPGFDDITKSALTTIDRVGALSERLGMLADGIAKGEGSLGRLVTGNDFADRLSSVLANVDGAVVALRSTTERIGNGQGLLPQLVNDPAMPRRIVSVLDNLESLTSDIRSGRGTLGRLLSDDTLYQHITTLTARIDSVVGRFSDRTGSLGRLSTDTRLYDNITTSVQALDSLLRDLKTNPGRYVKVSVF